jgi:catechol 2,3-dioxygenase-like lactoylglutathione lyase family enzyme
MFEANQIRSPIDAEAPPKCMDRRHFVLGATLAAPMLAAPVAAQTAKPALTTSRLNNVMIAVADLDRSVNFYQKLFGPAVMDSDVAIIRVGEGPDFLGITQVKNGGKTGFLSYGLAMENFDAARVSKALTGINARTELSERNGTPEVWIYDPDNIKIQLQDVTYGHGAGPLGAQLRRAPARSRPAFDFRTINHVTLFDSNFSRSYDFYARTFGWPVQVKQGTTWCLAVGKGPGIVVLRGDTNNPNIGVGINHACFALPGFDPNTAMNILVDNGLEPVEYGAGARVKPLTCSTRLRQRANNGGGPGHWLGTPELYFNDPDNIVMQLQDVSYCGGSGPQGEICP